MQTGKMNVTLVQINMKPVSYYHILSKGENAPLQFIRDKVLDKKYFPFVF